MKCFFIISNKTFCHHIVNLISGINAIEGSKNLYSIYGKLTCNSHRSTGLRFLRSYSWNHEYVTDERIFHAISEISNTSKDDDVGFLIIDYTLNKKDISPKHIDELYFHNSYADGNKPMWSHCLVTSHYTINDYSIPLNFKQYQRKKVFDNNHKKFKDKQQLAIKLINEFTPATKINYLLIDSWYTSAKILLHGLVNGCHSIGRIKCNRVIYPAVIKIGVDKFQVKSSKSINRYWSMVFLTYTFPEIFKVKNSKTLKFKTLGNTISYFRNNYLVQIVSFAHACVDNG